MSTQSRLICFATTEPGKIVQLEPRSSLVGPSFDCARIEVEQRMLPRDAFGVGVCSLVFRIVRDLVSLLITIGYFHYPGSLSGHD